METLQATQIGGENPLDGAKEMRLVEVTITDGDSALANANHVDLDHCRIDGRFALWHSRNIRLSHCHFSSDASSPLWYVRQMRLTDSVVDAPRAMREISNITLDNVNLRHAPQALWHCQRVRLKDVVSDDGDYLLMHSNDVTARDINLRGDGALQYCSNLAVRNSRIDSHHALWEADGVTVYNTELRGDFIGWHSRNLRLVGCHIAGRRPLCFASGLILEKCTMDPSCTHAFEGSRLHAQIMGSIPSVRNPLSGTIRAYSIGELVIAPNSDCQIITEK